MLKFFKKKANSDKSQGGFNWSNTKGGLDFWDDVINIEEFEEFYKRYPEYKKYNS